jgi:hypothetical protein
MMTTCREAPRGLLHSLPALLGGVALLAVLPILCGCSKKLQYGAVEGVITRDGQPLEEVEVVFYPDPDKGAEGPRSVAYTDKQGHYRMKDDKGRAGVPVGFCRVCINDIRAVPVTPQSPHGEEGARIPTLKTPSSARVPPQYSHWIQTPFKDLEIKPGSQTYNFEVSDKKIRGGQ